MSERDRVIEEDNALNQQLCPVSGWNAEMCQCRSGTHEKVAELEQEVQKLNSRLEDAEDSRLITLLTDIRQALGDDGKRMQDEFVEYCKGIGAELERLRLADQLLDSLPEETEVTIRKRGGMWPSRIYMPDGDLQAYCHGSTPTEAIKEAVSAFHALDKQADNGGEG